MAAKINGGLCFPAGFIRSDTGKPAGEGCLLVGGRKRGLMGLCVKASINQSTDRKINGSKVTDVNGSKNKFVDRSLEWVSESFGDVPMQGCKLGRFVEDDLVYRQFFVIRSYEVGADRTASMETLMNLLQETALNHVMSSDIAGDGFGATREMSKRKLIWVVTRIDIRVEKYCAWGDVVEIDTWVAASGKNGMRRDWIIRDYNTQQIIAKATSNFYIMNRETRKLSKMPEEVRKEITRYYHDRSVLISADNNNEKIDKLNDETAENIRSGLAPRWSDMDVNQHVNNVKYIGWILESVPMNILEDYNLASMTLEYRRECQLSTVLESLTSMKETEAMGDLQCATSSSTVELGSTHLLRMQEDKVEIVRARAQWRCRKHK